MVLPIHGRWRRSRRRWSSHLWGGGGAAAEMVLPIHGEVAAEPPEGQTADLNAVGRLSRCRSRGVAWPNTRPCQGRERRFESGRDRHAAPGTGSLERWPSPVEGDGLENRYGSLAHREFKSLPLRQTSTDCAAGQIRSAKYLAMSNLPINRARPNGVCPALLALSGSAPRPRSSSMRVPRPFELKTAVHSGVLP